MSKGELSPRISSILDEMLPFDLSLSVGTLDDENTDFEDIEEFDELLFEG